MNGERQAPPAALVDALDRYRAQVQAHLDAIAAGSGNGFAHLLAIEHLCRAMRAERWDAWTARRQAHAEQGTREDAP